MAKPGREVSPNSSPNSSPTTAKQKLYLPRDDFSVQQIIVRSENKLMFNGRIDFVIWESTKQRGISLCLELPHVCASVFRWTEKSLT